MPSDGKMKCPNCKHSSSEGKLTEKKKVTKKLEIVETKEHQKHLPTIKADCEKCGTKHKIFAKFKNDPKIDIDFKSRGFIAFPKDNILKCSCGDTIDLTGLRNDFESKLMKKIIT